MSDQSYMYVTPRTLLGIIRISQAYAKLNFRNEVTMNDVDESLKLMDYSFRTLKRHTGNNREKQHARTAEKRSDSQAEILRHVHELCKANRDQPIAISELCKRLQKKNSLSVDKEDLKSIMEHYHKLSVVYLNDDDEVMFI